MESREYHDVIVFEMLPFQVFSFDTKRKAGVYTYLWFEKRFWKAPFS